MKHKTPAIVFLTLSAVLLCAAIGVGLWRWGGGTWSPGAPEQTQPPASGGAPAGEDETAPAGDGEADEPAPTGAPIADDPDWDGPVVHEQDGLMGPAYFADAAFLGNEITSGLWLYNNDGLLPSDTDHWYCSDGLTVLAASPYAAQMPADTFGKVYIGFGINEVNYQKETLKAAYETVIDQVQASQPGAIIYLMSVTPVSKYCDENRGYRRSAVQSFNSMLQDIARERRIWYLDVYPALCGEDGFLPSEVTPDGINFSPAHYQKWFEYLRDHYVPDGTPPVATEVPEATDQPAPTDGGLGHY